MSETTPSGVTGVGSNGQVRKRVLVVDDSPTIVRILKRGLESLDYEVFSAEDGVEALEIVNEIPLDLVLTDINMPNMDGYELIVRIRAQQRFAILPIIVLTSVTDSETMRKSLDAGANIYLKKPAPMPKLRYKVQSLLGDASSADKIEKAAEVLERGDVKEKIQEGREELERVSRAKSVSPDMHIEMFLWEEDPEEVRHLLLAFSHRKDVDSMQVLPVLLDETLGEEQLKRLFRLMAFLKYEEFVIPLIHRFREATSIGVQKEIVLALGACGTRDYLPEIRQLHNRVAESTTRFTDEQIDLLDTFEDVIEGIENEGLTTRLNK